MPDRLPQSLLILIVDDEHLIRWSLGEHFTDFGHRVLLAPTLQAARGHLAEKPDLMLLDLALPDGNGLDFIGEAHATQPLLPIVVLSGHASAEVARAVKASGALDILQKPYAFDALDALLAGLYPPTSATRPLA